MIWLDKFYEWLLRAILAEFFGGFVCFIIDPPAVVETVHKFRIMLMFL